MLRRCRGQLWTVVFALLILIGFAGSAWCAEDVSTLVAGGCPNPDCPPAISSVRPVDDIWVISTRHLDYLCETPDKVRLGFRQYDHKTCCWKLRSLAQFLATDNPQQTTRVWVHGNRIDYGTSLESGMLAYCQSTSPREPAIRFVIWSWPSDKVRGQLRDIRQKAERATSEAFYLGWLVRRVNPKCHLDFWSYSYGPRVVLSAIHLLGGGQLDGMSLAGTQQERQIRAIVMASAVDDDWLAPSGRLNKTFSQLDGLFSIRNSCDPVLRRYRWLYCRHSCAVALGYSGLASLDDLPEVQRKKVSQYDAYWEVGRKHDWERYLNSDELMGRVRCFFAQPAKDQGAAQAALQNMSDLFTELEASLKSDFLRRESAAAIQWAARCLPQNVTIVHPFSRSNKPG